MSQLRGPSRSDRLMTLPEQLCDRLWHSLGHRFAWFCADRHSHHWKFLFSDSRRVVMNRLRLGIFSCAIFAMGIGLASCGGDSYHQKEERYVFVTFNSTLPYWQEGEEGFPDGGEWAGGQVA